MERGERENVCVSVCGGGQRDRRGRSEKELKEQKEFHNRMEKEEKLGSTERGASTGGEQ